MDISFIIPTHNAPPGICATIQALTALRQLHYEIIVSDNGSTDDTCTRVRPLVDKVISRPTDVYTTLGECYNRGVQAATGEIIWFIDPASYIQELEVCADEVLYYFQHQPGNVALRLYVDYVVSDATPMARLWLSVKNVFKLQRPLDQCLVVRRSTFERIHGFDPTLTYSAEADLWRRLQASGNTTTLRHRQVVRAMPLIQPEVIG